MYRHQIVKCSIGEVLPPTALHEIRNYIMYVHSILYVNGLYLFCFLKWKKKRAGVGEAKKTDKLSAALLEILENK